MDFRPHTFSECQVTSTDMAYGGEQLLLSRSHLHLFGLHPHSLSPSFIIFFLSVQNTTQKETVGQRKKKNPRTRGRQMSIVERWSLDKAFSMHTDVYIFTLCKLTIALPPNHVAGNMQGAEEKRIDTKQLSYILRGKPVHDSAQDPICNGTTCYMRHIHMQIF